MISYWKKTKEIHIDDGLVLIIGYYNHKNEQERDKKALGVHWETYPQSRGTLSPCIIPKSTRDAILSGLLHKAVIDGKKEQVNKLVQAISFFNE